LEFIWYLEFEIWNLFSFSMIDPKLLRENPELVRDAVRKKRVDVDVDKILVLNERRRELIQKTETLKAEQNKLSKGGPKAPPELQNLKELKNKIKVLQEELGLVQSEFDSMFARIPNIPAPDVPEGRDDRDNVVLREVGKIPKFDFKVKDHVELGEMLDAIDIERAAKVSGTRFGYLKNGAVLLEFALVNFALETLMPERFAPVLPPVLIKREAMGGMGYLEHGGKDEMYVLEKDDLVLIGTSEQSIGPMHRDEVFEAKELPRRYVGFSSCFRREAGAYGKDTRGIMRVHQFDKVEMFSFTKPEDGDREHEFLLSMEEKFFQALKIPYRVVKMCTGDLGAPAARKYDLEAWIPSQERYREVTSTSTTTDFQARRLNIKYLEKDKTRFVHTLNGTAFAIGRTIVSILENYQTKKGTVVIPKVLQKWMRGVKELRPAV
jgi:seryl-tRNA synthetase